MYQSLTSLRSMMLLFFVQLQLFASPVAAKVMAWLPRINLYTGSIESEDLGSYKFFECDGGSSTSSDRSCTFQSDTDSDLVVYAGGAGVYSVLGLVVGVIVALCAIGYLIYSIFKLCCCCLCKEDPEKVKTRDGVSIWCTTIFAICLVFMFTAFCVSTFKGNYAITENTSKEYSVANSLTGVQNMVHSFEPSATHTLLSSTSNVMRPTLFVTNRTLNRAVSIHELIRAFQIMETTIPKLPDAHAVVDILNTTSIIVYNASDHMTLIIVNLEDTDVLVEVMLNGTQALQSQTIELTDSFDDIMEAITLLNASVYDTIDFVNEIVGDDGVIASSVDDLQAAQRVENGGLLPNTNVFDDASTGSTGSTQRLISGDMNGVPAEITLMNDKLIAIERNISALPNFAETADNLIELNDTINSVLSPNGLLNNLTTQMEDLSNLVVEPIPILNDISNTITSFKVTLDSLVIEMRDTIYVMRIMLPLIESLLPQFDFLVQEVTKLYHTDELLPIMDIMINQFRSVNDTLFVLTEPFNDAIDSINDVNGTIQDFLYNGTLDEMLDQLDDAEVTTVDAVAEADDQINNLEDFLDVLEESLDNYDIGAINASIAEASELLSGINFDDVFGQIEDFTDALSAINIDSDFVDSLYALQTSFGQFLSVLDTAVGDTGDYILLAQGYCTGRPDLYCDNDADCASAGTICNIASKGTYRCASPIGDTLCTEDSTCTGVNPSAYCLADDTRATTLHALLVGFADDTSDLDVAGILEDLEGALVTGDIDFEDALGMIDDGVASMEAFNTTEVLSLIAEVEDGIAEVDTSSVIDTLESTQSSIDEVDFNGFVEDIDSNLELYDRVANNTFIEKWIESFETIKDFMYGENHLRSYLGQLEESVLREQLTLGGPSFAMSHVGGEFDKAYNDIRINQSGIDMKKLDKPMSESFSDTFEVLDKMGASRYPNTQYSSNDQHGAMYYLFALANNYTIGNVQTVPAQHPLARGVFANAEGFRYEDPYGDDDDGDESSNVYCFTASCFEHTINIINTAPMSEVSDELFPKSYDDDGNDDGSSTLDSDLSREEVMTLLWVPVLVLLGIGVFSLIFSFIPSLQKLHKGCNCCFLSCALLLVPIIFIFSSIFVLFAIVGEDVCTSGTALGESYIKAYGDDYCNDMLQGTGTLDECKFNFTLPDSFGEKENITLSVNILDVYSGLFQDDCSMAVDPFEKIALDLAEQVQPLTSKASDEALENSDYELRPSLELIVNSTARNYGQVLYNLIAETNADGRKVMSCESMTLVYGSVEDTACEGVVMPGVWLIASWYFVAWSICCCGIPSSCSTLLKYKVVDPDAMNSESDSYDEEDGEHDVESSDEEIVALHDHYEPPPDDFSSDDDGVEMVSHPAPTTYTAVYTEAPPPFPGALVMSGQSTRSYKEDTGNSYLDRSSGSSQSLGLQVNDSRFQTSRRL